MSSLTLLLPVIIALVGAAILLLSRTRQPKQILRAVVGGLIGFNGLGILASVAFALVALGTPMPVLAQGTETAVAAT